MLGTPVQLAVLALLAGSGAGYAQTAEQKAESASAALPEVVVTATGFFIAMTGKPYWPGQPGDPKRQQDLIRRIGEAFDGELAEGRHEAMFEARPESGRNP